MQHKGIKHGTDLLRQHYAQQLPVACKHISYLKVSSNVFEWSHAAAAHCGRSVCIKATAGLYAEAQHRCSGCHYGSGVTCMLEHCSGDVAAENGMTSDSAASTAMLKRNVQQHCHWQAHCSRCTQLSKYQQQRAALLLSPRQLLLKHVVTGTSSAENRVVLEVVQLTITPTVTSALTRFSYHEAAATVITVAARGSEASTRSEHQRDRINTAN
eukprot:2768-Heterococcus_DN1.PRE.3